jgi:hypothetical protein
VSGRSPRAHTRRRRSVSISPPTITPIIRDAGVVARLWNVSDGPVQCTLALDEGTIASARRTTHIETGLGPVGLHNGRLPVSLAARQMRTYAFKLSDVR